jgi:hypothetical protein
MAVPEGSCSQGPSSTATRGFRGTAANWQNHHYPHAASFTVELPAGALTPGQVAKQVRAVLTLASR